MGAGATLWIWNYPAVSYWIGCKMYEAKWMKADEDDWKIADFDYTERYYELARIKYWNLLVTGTPEEKYRSMLYYANCCQNTSRFYEAIYWYEKFQKEPWQGKEDQKRVLASIYECYRHMAMLYAESGDELNKDNCVKQANYIWLDSPDGAMKKGMREPKDMSKDVEEKYDRYLRFGSSMFSGLRGERAFLGLMTILFVMTPYCILVSMFVKTYRKYGRRKDVYSQTSFGN
jgi:hypothetical protein